MVTNQTSAGISVAPNNLHKMVVKSGLKNQMVAELKGIQPGTLFCQPAYPGFSSGKSLGR